MGTMPQWVSAVVAVFAVIVTVFLNSNATKRMEGIVVTRLDGHDRDIARIDHEQGQQWKEIDSTGKSLEKIKGKLGMNGA